ncbi:MAG: ATP-dependent DNA helicase RecG [Gammaproteobacteria bacterium]|nr:ATP-dependent DNA helicase RecG [Gammaproteobacteria bacterium]
MLSQDCTTLPGVGPALAGKLAVCGIHSIQDLLFHLPYRYQDRTRITPIRDVRHQTWAVVVGRICKTEIKMGRRRTLQCFIEDKTGILRLRFFHFNRNQMQAMQVGMQIRVFGEIRFFDANIDMIHPEYQFFDEDTPCPVEETLTPIYSTTQGLSQQRLRQLVTLALTHAQAQLQTLEWMTHKDLEAKHLQPLPAALNHLHHPPPDCPIQLLESGQDPALKRLAFDELIAQRLSMLFARRERATLTAPSFTKTNLVTAFLEQLPFQLTAAQTRVHAEIQHDLNQAKPMLRLVQGDVGCGKTVIAATAAMQAIANGYQVALMAPTDILSEQHAQTLKQWCDPLGISMRRLSAKMKAPERREAIQALAQDQCQLIVGTHALFQEEVQFARLGLIIIDEQHRFGVAQRMQLQQKGQKDSACPHQLFMTATPIPRTLAMTQLAHLEISIIDELPPGRTPITTVVLNQTKRDDLITRLQTSLTQGRQAYWVCTLIEESETLQCQTATETAQQLQDCLPELRIGLIHGRLKGAEKEQTMAQFKQGAIDILVATTVIEVGVDVPNANVMIIENAERLGLSQLHQLRGRVGRGAAESHCLLLYQPPLSPMSRERLQLMRETNDGFVLAEKDLVLRGAGEILGTKQTGYRAFKIADLQRDQALLSWLTPTTQQLMATDPTTAHAIATRWLGHFEPLIVT